jgi:outer membrane protein
VRVQSTILPVIVLGAAMLAPAQTATPAKVGVINIQAAIVSTKDGQKAAQDMEGKFGPKRKEMESKQGEINALRDQLQKGQNTMSEEAKSKLVRDIDTRTKSFNREAEDAQAELEQEQQRVFNALGQKLLAVLDKVAREQGFTVVLDVSQQPNPVMFAAPSVDLTQDVIKLYDANSAAGTALPPATTTAVPKPATPPPAAAKKPAAAPAK